MDARERLRLYLEQRRELGESELVLDTLPMADALAMIGAALPAGGTRRPALRRPSATTPTPPAPPSPDAGRSERTGDPAPVTEPAPAVAPIAPPAPVPRFDPAGATRDWRSALRAGGVSDAPLPPSPAPLADQATPPPADLSAEAVPGWLTALEVPLGLSVGASRLAPATAASLSDVATSVATCTACPLVTDARQAVPGEGNPHADFVCVGEGPGQQEDETGRPFVGPSGELLTKILAAIHFSREEVFICNVVKHRPPGNRTPTPDEIQACRPFLAQQLALLRPRVILALGSTAANTLLGTSQALGALRGRIHRYHGVPVVVTYHPSALLRNEAWKRPAWQDVQLARRIHDAAIAASAT